jgi:hypothetical protein
MRRAGTKRCHFLHSRPQLCLTFGGGIGVSGIGVSGIGVSGIGLRFGVKRRCWIPTASA